MTTKTALGKQSLHVIEMCADSDEFDESELSERDTPPDLRQYDRLIDQYRAVLTRFLHKTASPETPAPKHYFLASLSDDSLWHIARLSTSDRHTRLAAIDHLIARTDPEVLKFLLSELALASEGTWRDSLLGLLERVAVPAAQRALVVAMLSEEFGRRLQLHRDIDSILWTIIRKLTGLLGVSVIPLLLSVLSESAPLSVRQTIFQSVQNAFAFGPPAPSEAVLALQLKASEHVRAFGNPLLVESPQNASVAVNAFHAAAALASPDLVELAHVLSRLNRPWLKRDATRRLESVLNNWRESRVSEESQHHVALALNAMNIPAPDRRE